MALRTECAKKDYLNGSVSITARIRRRKKYVVTTDMINCLLASFVFSLASFYSDVFACLSRSRFFLTLKWIRIDFLFLLRLPLSRLSFACSHQSQEHSSTTNSTIAYLLIVMCRVKRSLLISSSLDWTYRTLEWSIFVVYCPSLMFVCHDDWLHHCCKRNQWHECQHS